MAARPSDPDKYRRIIQAARDVLARNGYAEATISQVAAEAGVSRGLLHYYFTNKEDMMARAVRAGAEVSLNVVESVFQANRTPSDLARGFREGLKAIAQGDPNFIHLMLESWAVSRRSQVVAGELRANYRLFRQAVGGELQRALEEKRISTPIPVQTLAALLIGLFDGLGLQLVLEPDLLSTPGVIEGIESAIRGWLTFG